MVYKGPGRLNAVSVTLGVLALAAGYSLWRFFPAYFDAWTVDQLLSEAGSAAYKLNRLDEAQKRPELQKLLDKLRDDIHQRAHVDDPELSVNMDIDETQAELTADYDVVVSHPLVSRTSRLHFHRARKTDVSRVHWE